VSDNDPLATAVADWQRKYRIADDDPILAVLELVRLQLQHARVERTDSDTAPPGFEDFRGTIELLDRRSKAFVNQSADLLTELRRFGLNVQRMNRGRFATQLMLVILGAIIGTILVRLL
jgi:hypothetical protein